ncbi:MAG: acyl-CoA dehydrogenase family protein [Candidatus Binataceae bacterium]
MAAPIRPIDRDQHDRLIAGARDLIPMLRRTAAAADQNRRLPDQTVAALQSAGLLRLSVPRRFGGLEADLPIQFEVTRMLGRGCGSTSWVVALFCVTTWIAAKFPDEALREVFTGPDSRVAGTVKPGGSMVAAGGGYLLNGTWPFNTGCLHATWDMIASVRREPDGASTPCAILVPMRDLQIQDDWRTTGMRGTGSHSVVARDLFVPEYRVMPLFPFLAGQSPPNMLHSELLYRYPPMPFLMADSTGTLIGIAEGAMAAFLERLPERKAAFELPTQPAAQTPRIQLAVAEAQTKIDAALALTYQMISRLQHHVIKNEALPREDRVRVRAHVGYVTRLGRESVEILMAAAGGTAHYDHVPLQRYFRDMETLCNHGILDAGNNLELYGRMLVGEDLGTAFI